MWFEWQELSKNEPEPHKIYAIFKETIPYDKNEKCYNGSYEKLTRIQYFALLHYFFLPNWQQLS